MGGGRAYIVTLIFLKVYDIVRDHDLSPLGPAGPSPHEWMRSWLLSLKVGSPREIVFPLDQGFHNGVTAYLIVGKIRRPYEIIHIFIK